eukprot:scaffold6073_cov55-Isochrysis_galbana.AAC.1
MSELASHRKYRSTAERDPIDRALAAEKATEPKRIPYALSPHPKFSGYAVLAYLPKIGKPPTREFVKVRRRSPSAFPAQETGPRGAWRRSTAPDL